MNRRTPGLPVHHQLPEFTQTSIESVMPSSHLILIQALLLLPPIPPSIRVFSNESTLRMRWPKYWSFSFSIILAPSKSCLWKHIWSPGMPCKESDFPAGETTWRDPKITRRIRRVYLTEPSLPGMWMKLSCVFQISPPICWIQSNDWCLGVEFLTHKVKRYIKTFLLFWCMKF